jgi:hypothetical protein
MVDRLAGAIRVPAPTLAAYPQTLLSILEARGLLHDAPEGSHLQNGVWWESEAAIRGNDDVTYTEGSFSSEDKTIQHGIAVTTGFAFELSRYIQLGVAGGTQAEQEARAQRRFEAWESYDVARHIRTFLEANDTVVAGTYGPVDAVAALLAQVALVYQASHMVLSGRGPSVRPSSWPAASTASTAASASATPRPARSTRPAPSRCGVPRWPSTPSRRPR